MLKGIGASRGYGIGKAVVIKDCNLDYKQVKYAGAEEEKQKLHTAVDTFVEETKTLAENLKQSAGEKEAEILEGHLGDYFFFIVIMYPVYTITKSVKSATNSMFAALFFKQCY